MNFKKKITEELYTEKQQQILPLQRNVTNIRCDQKYPGNVSHDMVQTANS